MLHRLFQGWFVAEFLWDFAYLRTLLHGPQFDDLLRICSVPCCECAVLKRLMLIMAEARKLVA